jgi:hypothetical protein
MHALERVGTNDDVRNASAVLENENGVGTASVFIRIARLTPIKLAVSVVLAAGDDTGLRERSDVTDGGGDVEGLRRGKAGKDRHEFDL